MYVFEKYDLSMFISRFEDYGRDSQFSFSGFKVLFNFLEELAEDTGEPIEIDVIGLCCDFTETELADIQRETGCEDLDDLRDSTLVLEVDDETIIYQAF